MDRAVGWVALLAWVGACFATGIYAAGWRTDNRIENWVGQFAEDPGYRVLKERFGGDEFLLVRPKGWRDGSPEHDDWLSAASERLAEAAAVRRVVGNVLGGAVFDALGLESRDLLVQVRPESEPAARAELATLLAELDRDGAEVGLDVLAAGHPLVDAALDRESARIEQLFAPLLAVLALAGIALLLRSIGTAILVLLPAVLASSGSRAGLRFAGVEADMLLVACGPLTFVLLVASTLHYVSAFRRHRSAGAEPPAAADAALLEKLPAGLLAALTTAVGFGVFVWSGLRSVQLLGAAVSLTMIVVVPVMFFGLHPLLAGLPLAAPRPRRIVGRWRTVALFAVRWRLALFAAAVLGLVLGVVAFLRLEHETNALHYFPRGDPVRDEFLALEAEGGALSGVDVLLRRGDEEPWKPEGLHTMKLADELRRVEGVRGAFGPEDVPADPTALRVSGRLDQHGAWARWTVRFPTREAEPTRALVGRIESVTREHTEALGAQVLVAGSVPLMLEMQLTLVGTLVTSLALTAAATTLLFLLVARSPRELLAAFVVNLVPVASALFGAWVLGFPLDGATVMVAAIVLALAVDNTFHLMHAARANARANANGGAARARLRAFDRVGEPAFVSSLALALGFATLALSGFAPTARFGLLCAVGSIGALVADLLLLPAIWIVPRRAR